MRMGSCTLREYHSCLRRRVAVWRLVADKDQVLWREHLRRVGLSCRPLCFHQYSRHHSSHATRLDEHLRAKDLLAFSGRWKCDLICTT